MPQLRVSCSADWLPIGLHETYFTASQLQNSRPFLLRKTRPLSPPYPLKSFKNLFEASHQFVFELLQRGDVTGLRIDHVDGLWDPAGYLKRLQERFAEVTDKPEDRLYLLVEKIVEMRGEYLPADWPVHGTTGYEFANQVTHVLVDKRSEKHLTKTWDSFAGNSPEFERLAYEKKHLIMEASFQSEILALGRKLDELS